MSRPLVFVTGATGHIGFVTLTHILKKGYRARVSSRKLASAQKLKDLPSIKPFADSVSFVEIPDVLATGAFDNALKDVDYVLHIASPLPDDSQIGQDFDLEKEYVDPAIQGNLEMLRAAQKSPSVKRVVITSSVAILAKREGASSVGPDDVAPVPKVEEIPKHPWAAYAASKILAHAAAEDFIENEKLHFDLVHILPTYVQGRNEPVSTSKELLERPSSNVTMLRHVLGFKDTEPRPIDVVFVDDVAATHVAALEAKNVTSGERFIATYGALSSWTEIDPIVKKLFPKEVETGVFPLGGEQPGSGVGFDASKTVEKLGVQFHGLEDMVRSLIGQFVELKEKEKEKRNE